MGQKQKRRFDDIFIYFFASPVISTNYETGKCIAIIHWPPHNVTTLLVTCEHPFSVADHLKGKTVLPSSGAVPWRGGEACMTLCLQELWQWEPIAPGLFNCARGPKCRSFGKNQVSELKILCKMRLKLKQQQITTHEKFPFSVQLTKKTCHNYM